MDDNDDSTASTAQQSEEDPLEEHFRERQRLLRTILLASGDGKSSSFLRQLQVRERQVRCRTFQHAAANSPSSSERQRIRYQRDAVQQEVLLTIPRLSHPSGTTTSTHQPSSSSPASSRWCDGFVLEWHSGIMAMMSLWLHCGAYVGISYWVDAVLEPFGMVGWGCCSLLALVGLRATGDLSWWLDDETALCVDMDWENRVLLQHSKEDDNNNRTKGGSSLLQWCIWLRAHTVLRAAVFIVGYMYCMESCVYVAQLWERHWLKHDAWDTVVASLPSVVYEQDYGICEAEPSSHISFCSMQCQQEINDADRLRTTLQQQDLFYAWEKLPEADYEEFWYGYLVSEEPVRVQTILHYALFWSIATVVATALLWRCLGCKLWFKY